MDHFFQEKWSIIPWKNGPLFRGKMVHYSVAKWSIIPWKMDHYSLENGPLSHRKNGPCFRENGPLFHNGKVTESGKMLFLQLECILSSGKMLLPENGPLFRKMDHYSVENRPLFRGKWTIIPWKWTKIPEHLIPTTTKNALLIS